MEDFLTYDIPQKYYTFNLTCKFTKEKDFILLKDMVEKALDNPLKDFSKNFLNNSIKMKNDVESDSDSDSDTENYIETKEEMSIKKPSYKNEDIISVLKDTRSELLENISINNTIIGDKFKEMDERILHIKNQLNYYKTFELITLKIIICSLLFSGIYFFFNHILDYTILNCFHCLIQWIEYFIQIYNETSFFNNTAIFFIKTIF